MPNTKTRSAKQLAHDERLRNLKRNRAATSAQGPDFGQERPAAMGAEEDDTSLGIGLPSVEDVTSSRAFRDAVSDAVKAAMAERPPAGQAPADWADFMSNMRQLTEAFQVQSPGFNKPLPPEEVAKRASGRDEFFRLIMEAAAAVENFGRMGAKSRDLVPEYLVGSGGILANTDQGEQMFSPGQRLFYTEAPPKDFLPLNLRAGEIMHAQMQWLGLASPGVETLVKNGLITAEGGDPMAEDQKRTNRNNQFAEIVPDSGVVSVGARRIMGATVEESSDNGRGRFAITKGQVGRPVTGPVFA